MEPSEILDFANMLLQDSKYEVEVRNRCAINRAYYGAYHRAVRQLRKREHFQVGSVGVHKKVIQRVRTLKPNLGDRLLTLFDRRVKADYKLDREIPAIEAQRTIRLARSVAEELSRL